MAFSFELRDPEIEHFDLAILQEHDIVWLHIVMDNAMFMGVYKSLAYLFKNGNTFVRGFHVVMPLVGIRRPLFRHYGTQCPPLQILQNEIFFLPHFCLIEVLYNVRMAKHTSDLNLTLKPLENGPTTNHIVFGELENDVMPCVSIPCTIDGACNSLTQKRVNPVMINLLPRSILW